MTGQVLEDLCATIKSKMKKGLYDDMDLTRDPVDYFLSVKAYSHVQLSNTFEDKTKMIMQGLSLPDSSSSLSIPFSEKNFVSSNVPGINSESAGHIPYPSPSIALILPINDPTSIHAGMIKLYSMKSEHHYVHDLDNLSDLFQGLTDVTIGKVSVDFANCVEYTSDI
jgi:hypothetical protein